MHVDAFLNESGFATIQRKAALAERAGFDGVAFPEITGDPLISAAAAALATETITLRTAILVAFPRSPMVVAQAAWQVHEASGGRLVLGLGTQVKGHNERRFSVPWSAPYPRLRDYVWALRAIWQAWQTGERLNFISEHYTHTLMTPEFSPKPSEHGPIAVHAAAVRPAMLRLAGRVADGVRLHGFCTRAYLDQEVLPNLQQGMERVSRPRRAFEVCGGGFIATGPDQEAVAKRLEWIRYRIAFYGSTRTYWPVLAAHGWEELGAQLHAMSKRGQWAQMAALVTDEVVDAFAAVATWDGLATAVQRRFGGISDRVELLAPESEREADALKDVLADVRKVPTAFDGSLHKSLRI